MVESVEGGTPETLPPPTVWGLGDLPKKYNVQICKFWSIFDGDQELNTSCNWVYSRAGGGVTQ